MSKGEENIKAFVRVKPFEGKDASEKAVLGWSDKQVAISNRDSYKFTGVFSPTVGNQQVFMTTTHPLIQHNLLGFNSCILAYGQTSSGKTYTMKGNSQNMGLVPLTVKSIFKRIFEEKLTAMVWISYFEIHNENIIDLLSENLPPVYLELRENAKKSLIIDGLLEEEVADELGALKLFQQGEKRRKYADNTINFQSSRSHAIFRINLKIVYENLNTVFSHIDMVDLAGSESSNKSREGILKKQGETINKSLLALSNVIRGLSDKNNYVNFRDSKLTRILQTSLCHNSRSIIICTVKQNDECAAETANTLKFGVTAALIKNAIKKNITDSSIKINAVDYELFEEDKAQLARKIDEIDHQNNILRKENDSLKTENRFLFERNSKLTTEQKEYEESIIALKVRLESLQSNLQIQKNQCDEIRNEKNIFINESVNMATMAVDLQRQKVQTDKLRAQIKELKEKNQKQQRNQRSLIDKLDQYKLEIKKVQETLSKKEIEQEKSHLKSVRKDMIVQTGSILPSQPKVAQDFSSNEAGLFSSLYFEKKRLPRSPADAALTIGRIVTLSGRILDLKRQLYDYILSNASMEEDVIRMSNDITMLNDRIAKMEDHDGTDSRRSNGMVKNLKQRNERLKREVQICRKREARHVSMLRQNVKHRIEELDGFNKFIQQEKKVSKKTLYELYTDDSDLDNKQQAIYYQC